MSAVTHDPEQQLAWEARHRTRAGIVALVGAVGLAIFYVCSELLKRDAPTVSGLQALQRGLQPGPVETLPSLRTAEFEYLDAHMGLVLGIGVGGFIGFIGMAWAAGFLGVTARGRIETFRRFLIYVPIVGGVIVAVGILVAQIGVYALVSDFMDGPRTVREATKPDGGVRVFASVLYNLGSLTLAVGLVLVALNAMRVGLLTRLFGYIGIIAGALLVMVSLPVVQVFWLAGLGFLFLGRWPGGNPPAWRTGKAEPWVSPAVAAAARAPKTATEPAAPKPGGSSRSKRKKRH